MAKKIFAQNPEKFIPALAQALRKIPEFQVPEWALYVKSGVSRERPPTSEDFWYIRAASILRQLYVKGVVGVNRLRTKYGSRKDRGVKPDRFRKAGGKIIRVILQQAESAGLVEKVTRLQHGRRLTEKGKELLDSIKVEEKINLNYENLISKPAKIENDEIDTDSIEIDENLEDNEEELNSEDLEDNGESESKGEE
jgi:small subunit ribosomal protein S19e